MQHRVGGDMFLQVVVPVIKGGIAKVGHRSKYHYDAPV
jgi:hypothetical protein